MNIPLIDLKSQYREIADEIDAAFRELCETQGWILGAAVERFEREVAAYHGVPHAIGCASGTDALLLALMAYGIGPGDEVIAPTLTFGATGMAIARSGATPVFIDVDPVTYTIDVEKAEAAVTEKTRAIVPVHLYGQAADMDAVLDLARRRNLKTIEDAAQAIGALDRGKKVGTLGEIGCFSCYPGKNLGAYGDAGFMLTADPAIDERLRELRVHGSRTDNKYEHVSLGLNSRLDGFQAAVLSVKLKRIDAWNAARRKAAERYHAMLGRDGSLGLPATAPDREHVWHLYVVLHPERDRILAGLREAGVASQIYYPIPLHQQPCFADLGYGGSGDFPIAERVCRENFALPMFPELTEKDQAHVAETLGRLLAASAGGGGAA